MTMGNKSIKCYFTKAHHIIVITTMQYWLSIYIYYIYIIIKKKKFSQHPVCYLQYDSCFCIHVIGILYICPIFHRYVYEHGSPLYLQHIHTYLNETVFLNSPDNSKNLRWQPWLEEELFSSITRHHSRASRKASELFLMLYTLPRCHKPWIHCCHHFKHTFR